MSGITPILDTLLHQVLGRRVDTTVHKDQPTPVSPSTSANAIQPARSDSRLHQQGRGQLGEISHGSLDARARSSLPVPAAQTGQPSAQTHLSRTATEIADVLAKFPPSTMSAIKPFAPLLQAAPASADSLSGLLSRSIAESGIFYESHLLRWMAGSYPRSVLWREPQAWLALSFRPLDSTVSPLSPSLHGWSVLLRSGNRMSGDGVSEQAPGAMSARTAGPWIPLASSEQARSVFLRPSNSWGTGNLGSSPPSALSIGDSVPTTAATQAHQLSQQAPESLQALVRHQLELIVSSSLRWEGQLWPGVPLTLTLVESPEGSVDEESTRKESAESTCQGRWRGELCMTLPRLGEITMTLEATGGEAWQIAIEPHQDTSRAPIEMGLGSLEARLQQGGLSAEVRIGKRGIEHG